MKKTFCLLLTVLLSFCLCSCEKVSLDDLKGKEGNKEEQAYSIKFITKIQNDGFDVTTSRAALKDVCTKIDYAVFKNDERVVNKSQTNADEDYGTIGLDLTEGTYKLVIVAHSGLKKATLTSPQEVSFDGKLTDTFVYSSSFTVSENSQTQEVLLKRCVAKVVVNITQPTPAEVVKMQFYYTGGSSTLDATTAVGSKSSRQTEVRDVASSAYSGTSNYEIFTFPRTDSEGIKLTVSALDASGNKLYEKVIENVPVKKNEITTCTGKFFSDSQGGSQVQNGKFSICIEDNWVNGQSINF